MGSSGGLADAWPSDETLTQAEALILGVDRTESADDQQSD